MTTQQQPQTTAGLALTARRSLAPRPTEAPRRGDAALRVAVESGSGGSAETPARLRAELARAAREALAEGRNAVALLQTLIDAADLPRPDVAPAPEQVCAGAQALEAVADALLRRSGEVRRLATRLAAPPAARLRAAAELLQQFQCEHAALAARAAAMLDGGPAILAREVLPANDCGLGQWCQGPGRAEWGHLPGWEAMAAPHVGLHRTLAAVLFAHQQGQAQAAARALRELHTHRLRLEEALQGLLDAMRAAAEAEPSPGASAVTLPRLVIPAAAALARVP